MKLTGKHTPRVRGLPDPDIRRRLIEVRHDFGLEQKAFGERVGLSQAVVSRYEGGTPVPKVATIAIGAVYGVNPEWLSSGSGERYLPPSKVKLLSTDLELLQLIKRYSVYSLMSDCMRHRAR